MRTLLRNKANTVKEPLPSPGVSLVSLSIYHPSDGTVLATPAVTVQGTVATTTDAIISGDAEIPVDSVIPAGIYYLTSPQGDYEVVEVVRGTAGVAYLRDGVGRSYDVGSTLTGYYVTASYTPDDSAPDSVVLEWTYDGTDVTSDVAVVVMRKLRPPIRGTELLALYPRLKELGASEYAGEWGD